MHSICNQVIEGEKLFASTCVPSWEYFFILVFKVVSFSMVLFVHLIATIYSLILINAVFFLTYAVYIGLSRKLISNTKTKIIAAYYTFHKNKVTSDAKKYFIFIN
jgi:hypothetical protein